MAQRLELKQIKGPAKGPAGQRWYFERGQRTLGRSADCDWQIPDPQRTASKLHCTIKADANGFALYDESANGTKVDGKLVLEGEVARLSHGTVIEVGEFTFSVTVTGEKVLEIGDPDTDLVLGDENLTVSAILADVTPGGPRSNDLRGQDVWPDMHTNSGAERHNSAGTPSSRNVEIGWRGPPDVREGRLILPEDWNEDSDYSSQLEHTPATRTSVALPRSRKKGDSGTSDRAETQEARPEAKTPSQVEFQQPAEPAVEETAPVDVIEPLEVLAKRSEEAGADLFAVFGLETRAVAPASELPGSTREEALVARFEAVLSTQIAFRRALGGLLDEVSRTLEPPVVEAHVDAEPRKLPWLKDRSYWQAYKANFERGGKRLSLRDVFREAMLRALDGNGGGSAVHDEAPEDDVEVDRHK